MKFKIPADLKALLDDALAKLRDDALDEYAELVKVDDADLTDEQLDDIEALKAFLKDSKAEVTDREAAAEARLERIKAAKEAPEEGDEDESDDESGNEDESDDDESDDDEEADAPADKEPILASGARKAVVRTAARKAKRPAAEDEGDEAAKASMIASGDYKGFSNGQEMSGMSDATKAFMARLAGMPGGGRLKVGSQTNKYGVATITMPGEDTFKDFSVDTKDTDEVVQHKLFAASRERRLTGGSIVAAGGWCAPSENFYDLCQWETTSGGLDLPEITVTRGGINFTKGPEFSTIYNDPDVGFLQTESQAEAGTVKPFLEIDCPDWTEVRLDAIGYGVKAPILTASAAGYPELVQRYLEGALTAHWHHKNAYVINKVLGFLGAAQNFAELGSGTGDTLYAIEVAAQSLRYKFRLGENATLEAMFPMWAKSAIRADLAYRTGVDMLGITDAQIQSWFTLRGIRPQYVYDWAAMEVSGSALALPATMQFGIWPAGTFVKGTNNIISLDAIYDSTEIETNTYTAAFFEEAILVANTCGNGRLFELGFNYAGRTGAAEVGGNGAS